MVGLATIPAPETREGGGVTHLWFKSTDKANTISDRKNQESESL